MNKSYYLTARIFLIFSTMVVSLWKMSEAFAPHFVTFNCKTLTSIQPKYNHRTTEPTNSINNNFKQKERVFKVYSQTESDNADDGFMASLRSRVEEINVNMNRLPLVVLDSMLPRQVLRINVRNPLLVELVRDCIHRESPYFGMVGLARLANGQTVHLNVGVEVEIASAKCVDDDTVLLEIRAGRRFRIEGDVRNSNGDRGWTEARVEFLDSKKEEEREIKEGEDRMAVARAISKSTEWTTTTTRTPSENSSLVNQWIRLAKTKEREPGQIDKLLEQLGEIPPPEDPSERAFWIGALINPLPAMGVAYEIRPALLTAKTAEQRVQIASKGLLQSVRHMDGSAPLW